MRAGGKLPRQLTPLPARRMLRCCTVPYRRRPSRPPPPTPHPTPQLVQLGAG